MRDDTDLSRLIEEASCLGTWEDYRRGLADLAIPYGPEQCAPALGVHEGCEHDERTHVTVDAVWDAL